MSYELRKLDNFKSVLKVKKGSIAEELGIEKGFKIISVNDTKIIDVIDYMFLMNDDYVTVEFEDLNGERYIYDIEKDFNEDLGVVFESELLDKPRTCRNNCIFCFMNQLPKNVRNTLVYKDDDYRLSFFSGNYVTMTNMTEEDIDRIIKYRLSPINISIHATDPDIRCKIMNNPNAGIVLKYIDKLYENDIKMNMQIVLCKDINDGDVLNRSIEYLSKYIPAVRCIAIVPVGITKYRKDLVKIEPFNKEDCVEVVKDISKFQKIFKEKYNENYVYLADEFYIKGNKKIPDYTEYGDFENIENGIGMIANFDYEFNKELKEIVKVKNDDFNKLEVKDNIVLLTGKITEKYIKDKVDELLKVLDKDLNIKVKAIENTFFGSQITVTGLITGNDIINQIKDISKDKLIVIPDVCLKDGYIFLDDVTIQDVKKVHENIFIGKTDAKGFINNIVSVK